MRVADNMLGTTLTRDLQRVQGQLLQVQQQLSTGQRINAPSDNPTGTENVLQWDGALAQNAQDQSNAKDAQTWLETGSGALSSAVNVLQQVRDLAVSVGSGDLTPSQLQTIADQVRSAQDSLAQLANTRLGPDYIFSGEQTATPAFAASAGGAWTYQGNSGAITRELAPGIRVEVNIPGGTAFGAAFAAIGQILGDLGPGGSVANVTGADLQQLDGAINGLTSSEGLLGGRAQQVDTAASQLTAMRTTLQQLRAGTLDTDVAKAVVQLQQLQLSYQSALAVGAQLMQKTLANYLP